MPTLLNAALIFDNGPANRFEEYSSLLASRTTFDVALGPANLPHLTILQFEAEGDPSAWRRLSSIAAEPIPLSLAGLTFVPTKEGHVWVEIQALKSAALQSCQDALRAAIGSRPIHNGVEDAFRPHITIGRIADSRNVGPLPLDEEIVRMKGLRGRLAVGRSGSNYEFLDLL